VNRSYLFQFPYPKINLIFAGIIVCVFIYSGIFSPEKANHPIPSGYRLLTGESTKSSGLSRAFSAIMQLEFDKALIYNEESLKVFSFFIVQLFFRLLFTLIYARWKNRKVVTADISLSVLLFICCFEGLIPV